MDPKVLERLGLCPEDNTPKTIVASPRPNISKAIPCSKNEFSDFIESCPPVLESSKDESHFEDESRKPDSSRRLRTRSLDFEPSEIPSIVSCHERIANCCIAVYNCYKDSVVKFRNSVFMIIMQLLFCSIPISALVMGVHFSEDCSKVQFLPVFSAVMGAIGLIFMTFWMYASCSNLNGRPSSNRQKILLVAAFFLLFIITIVDAVFVVQMSATFDSSANEHCYRSFYSFTFYRVIATLLIVFLTAMIYIPGSRHILCCQNCSLRSHPNPVYNVI